MFKLVSLKSQGFKLLDLAKPLFFPDGLFLIHGRNESGKSTIMEAIHYALYGLALKPKKKASNEDLINYSSPEGAVELEFEVDENRYRVRRVLRRKGSNHHELVVSKKDGSEERVRGYYDVNSRIEYDLHGIDSDALLNSCLVEQKELGKLEAAQRSERIRAVTTLLNIEAFVDASDDLKSDRRELDKEISEVEKKLEEQRRRKEDFEKAVEKKETAEKRLREIFKELPSLEDEVERLSDVVRTHAELKEKRKELDHLKERISDASKALQEARDKEKEIERISAEIEEFLPSEAAQQLFEKVEGTASSLSRVRREHVRLRKRSEETRDSLEALRNIEERVQVLREKRRTLDVQRQSAARRRMLGIGALVSGTIVTVLAVLLPFPLAGVPGAVLLVLGGYLAVTNNPREAELRLRQVQEDLEKALSKSSGLDQLREELSQTESEIEALQKEEKEVSERLEDVLEQLPRKPRDYRSVYGAAEEDVSEAVKSLRAKIQEDTKKLAALRSSKKEIKREAEKAEEREEKLSQLRDAEQVLQGEIWELARQMDQKASEAGISPDDVEKKEAELDDLKKRLGGLEQEKKERREEIEEATRVIEEKQDAPSRFDELSETFQKNRFELEALDRAVRLLDSTRDQIVAGVKDRIENHMMRFLPTLTAGRYNLARIDETDYLIEIYDREARDWRSKGVFSGATQDQFSLALRLAFALSTLPSTRGARPAFIFLDEPLSGFDAERRKGLLELLREQLTQSFDQIIVVSHITQLRQEIPKSILLEEGHIAGGSL